MSVRLREVTRSAAVRETCQGAQLRHNSRRCVDNRMPAPWGSADAAVTLILPSRWHYRAAERPQTKGAMSRVRFRAQQASKPQLSVSPKHTPRVLLRSLPYRWRM
jgi:hypothetical protein